MNSGRVIGIILVVIGMAIGLIGVAWVSVSSRDLTGGATVLGLALTFVLAAPFVGAGAYLLVRGLREAAEFAEVEKERKLLGMVKTQGQVRVSDVALELDASRDQVKGWLYDLVDKGLFAGYVNWEEGTLYSRDAAQLGDNRCPNCGGTVELAGKGVVGCPYCGAEIFLAE
jgi:hypothetical protein